MNSKYIAGCLRGYEVKSLSVENPEELFSKILLDSLQNVAHHGIIRKFDSRQEDPTFRGRFLLGPSLVRYFSKSLKFKQVHEVTDLTVDVFENRIIKQTLSKLIGYYTKEKRLNGNEIILRATILHRYFDHVSNCDPSVREIFYELPKRIVKLPKKYQAYEGILWICYLILTRQGISLEQFGPTKFESLLINLSEVFESYVRELIRENIETIAPSGIVIDGNVNKARLFSNSNKGETKPDIYINIRGKNICVFEVKYKPILRASDIYETLAFCEALITSLAIIITPFFTKKERVTYHGTTPRGIKFYEIYINLGAENIAEEEKLFSSALKEILLLSQW